MKPKTGSQTELESNYNPNRVYKFKITNHEPMCYILCVNHSFMSVFGLVLLKKLMHLFSAFFTMGPNFSLIDRFTFHSQNKNVHKETSPHAPKQCAQNISRSSSENNACPPFEQFHRATCFFPFTK